MTIAVGDRIDPSRRSSAPSSRSCKPLLDEERVPHRGLAQPVADLSQPSPVNAERGCREPAHRPRAAREPGARDDRRGLNRFERRNGEQPIDRDQRRGVRRRRDEDEAHRPARGPPPRATRRRRRHSCVRRSSRSAILRRRAHPALQRRCPRSRRGRSLPSQPGRSIASDLAAIADRGDQRLPVAASPRLAVQQQDRHEAAY